MTLKEKRSGILAQAKEIIERAVAESRAMTPEEKEQHDAFVTEADAFQATIEAEERMAQMTKPATPAIKFPVGESRGTEKANDEYRSAFYEYLGGKNAEKRAITVSANGALLPVSLRDRIVTGLRARGGIFGTRATVYPNLVGTVNIPVANDVVKGHRLNASDATSVDPSSLQNKALVAYDYTSDIIPVDKRLFDNSPTDIEAVLADMLIDRVFRAYNYDATVGTGANQPEGVLTASGLGKTAASTTATTYDEVVDLFHSVPSQFRLNAEWMMNDNTLRELRKLKNTVTDEPLYNERDNTILGKTVVINDDMPDMGAGAKAILFGDFSRYFIGNGPEMAVDTMNETFKAKGQIGLILISAHGGILADAAGAVKHLKMAAV